MKLRRTEFQIELIAALFVAILLLQGYGQAISADTDDISVLDFTPAGMQGEGAGPLTSLTAYTD